jgi:hypothetical protein
MQFVRQAHRLHRPIMQVTTVPMLKDNLGYLVQCATTGKHFFVDISHSSTDKFFNSLTANNALDSDLVVLTTHKVCFYIRFIFAV